MASVRRLAGVRADFTLSDRDRCDEPRPPIACPRAQGPSLPERGSNDQMDTRERVSVGAPAPETKPRKGVAIRVAAGVAALGLITAAVIFLAGGPAPSSSGPAATIPGATPEPGPTSSVAGFEFGLNKVVPIAVVPGSGWTTAQGASEKVRTVLSSLYQAAFVTPAAWGGEVDGGVWASFAPAIRNRAKADAGSLTAAVADAEPDSVRVESSSLVVRVLIGPSGKANAALAAVSFTARGDLPLGQQLVLTNEADLVLRLVDGKWLIVAYPQASTKVATASPSPAPSPTPSASGSASGPPSTPPGPPSPVTPPGQATGSGG
jgi:hypothetical protein